MGYPLCAGYNLRLWALESTNSETGVLSLSPVSAELRLMLIVQENERFALAKGCAAAPVWASRAPLGLDLLVRAFWHGRDRTVCEFFTEISEISRPTHEQLLRTYAM